jgi:hypothetical protein
VGSTTGYHKKCTLVEQGSDPAAVTDAGILYAKDVGGNSDLFYRNNVGIINVVKGGALAIPAGLIAMWSGTISSPNTIPSGWVLCDGNNGSPNLLDRFIKSVLNATTNPGGTGGSATHDHGGSTGSTTLTAEQSGLPAHSHTVTNQRNANGWASGDFFQGSNDSGPVQNLTVPANSAQGASQGHNHTISGVSHEPSYYTLAFIYKT